ncbi:MAG: hypothetical protein RIQ53_2856, partial [Pseudomonadota bacterium]
MPRQHPVIAPSSPACTLHGWIVPAHTPGPDRPPPSARRVRHLPSMSLNRRQWLRHATTSSAALPGLMGLTGLLGLQPATGRAQGSGASSSSLSASSASAAPAGGHGQPLELVVPVPPGGSVDLTGRLLAEHLPRALHQAVVVRNQPGASGSIAAAAVARQAGNGDT